MRDLNLFQDFDYANRRVLVRVDFNVPFNADGSISDATRIEETLPTIRHLIKNKAKVILMSHLGRPDGKVVKGLSLGPVAKRLGEMLGQGVELLGLDPLPLEFVKNMKAGDVVLLENLRFDAGEEGNDVDFVRKLASLGEAYVNDAFGTAHRAHASTYGVALLLKDPAAGFLIQKEVEFLGHAVEKPKRPFTVILGGAKVSDKINVINKLLEKADRMIIGGAMAYTFKLAQGYGVGDSLVEKEKVGIALEAIEKAKKLGVELVLPVDNLVTDKLDFKGKKLGEVKVVAGEIGNGWQGVDIGPETIKLFKKEIANSGTILWNGPMGIFEIAQSAVGTFSIAEAVANSGAVTVVGGGDSIKALNSSGYAKRISFISTGGGASLEFLEGKALPGIVVLEKKYD